MTMAIKEDESGDISRKTTTTPSTSTTQVETVLAPDDDNDDVDADKTSVAETQTTAGQRSRVNYQEHNKDLPFESPSVANFKLDTVF